MIQLLIGTQNPGKRREYEDLLAELPVVWVGPADCGLADFDPVEDGTTFEENAKRKALSYARAANLPALADDSGLTVDALGGAPGVYSARYAGPGTTDEDRYRKLLHEMNDVPDELRMARFVCVVALGLPDGRVFTAQGTVDGHIGRVPRGSHGFGYDPVFVLPDGRHFAELPAEEKHAISHRGNALRAFTATLMEVLTTLDSAE
jgi:XTP/dITP diphosphohydrolase